MSLEELKNIKSADSLSAPLQRITDAAKEKLLSAVAIRDIKDEDLKQSAIAKIESYLDNQGLISKFAETNNWESILANTSDNPETVEDKLASGLKQMIIDYLKKTNPKFNNLF